MSYIWMIVGIAFLVLGLVFFIADMPKTVVDQQVRVTLKEWAIQTDVQEIRPGPVRFVVLNAGALAHGLAATGFVNGQKQSYLILERLDATQMRTVLIELPRGEFVLHDPVYCRDPIRGNCEKKAVTMTEKLIVR